MAPLPLFPEMDRNNHETVTDTIQRQTTIAVRLSVDPLL